MQLIQSADSQPVNLKFPILGDLGGGGTGAYGNSGFREDIPCEKYKVGIGLGVGDHLNGKKLNVSEMEKDLGIYVSSTMKFARQCAEAVKKANKVIGIIKRNFTNFNRKVILNLYKSLVRPHLDYCIPVWRPYLKKDIMLLEGVQRRMTRIISGMNGKSYEERLQELGLMTIQQRHARQDLITFYNITRGRIKIDYEEFVDMISDSRTRGNSRRIRPSKVRLELRRNSYFQRIWKDWNKLPESVVTARTLNAFKSSLEHCGILKGH